MVFVVHLAEYNIEGMLQLLNVVCFALTSILKVYDYRGVQPFVIVLSEGSEELCVRLNCIITPY